jgi:methylenetetrahydrofolate dehydrogenase (NADP+) / methenyltetrahydrofolate cyclohydrolase
MAAQIPLKPFFSNIFAAMLLLDGKVASQAIKDQLQREVAAIVVSGARAPHLAAILVGNNAASETYVASKVKNCAEVGFGSSLIRRDPSITEQELIDVIDALNKDENVDGILVQLPLPKHINEHRIINAIAVHKDVDGFHPFNIGNMVIGTPTFIPATPYGVMLMLEHFGIQTSGKHCVVLGRSNIVGTPASILLSRNSTFANCTVTLCHSKTQNLKEIMLQADIVVAAIGIPHFVTADMIKQDAVIVDVGINSIDAPERKSGKRLVGDVDFEAISAKASAMTPVPGGVGLMTIAALLKNTLTAYKMNHKN